MISNRVAFYAPNLRGGGAERVISILASRFSQLGYEVDLLLGRAAGPYLKDIPDSVRIIDFGCNKMLLTLPKLISYLKRETPSVLLSSQMHTNTLALWAASIANANTNVIIRQPSMLRPKLQGESIVASIRRALLLWSARMWAYRVITTSQVMAREFLSLSKIDPGKVLVINNPLPISDIIRKSEVALDHPWYSFDQPPVVVAAGRLAGVKDFSTLITAFSLVRSKVEARLIILGEGAKRAELEQLVIDLGLENDVQMPGFVDNPFQYMRRSKVFVLSSLWEGFPNALIEAMACGTTVIATDCDGGGAEILGHGTWGALVPMQNSETMGIAILRALDNSRDSTARAADFDIDRIVRSYVDCFRGASVC